MRITNRTDSRRGITLSTGVLFIDARKSAAVPPELEREVRDLFKSTTFQRFADKRVFTLDGMKEDDESTLVETPAPPAELAPVVAAGGVQTPVSTETGARAQAPVVVEHQTGGPLPEADGQKEAEGATKAATKAKK